VTWCWSFGFAAAHISARLTITPPVRVPGRSDGDGDRQ
jgi:hypothetical protein